MLVTKISGKHTYSQDRYDLEIKLTELATKRDNQIQYCRQFNLLWSRVEVLFVKLQICIVKRVLFLKSHSFLTLNICRLWFTSFSINCLPIYFKENSKFKNEKKNAWDSSRFKIVSYEKSVVAARSTTAWLRSACLQCLPTEHGGFVDIDANR